MTALPALTMLESLPRTPASDLKKLGWRGVMKSVARHGKTVVLLLCGGDKASQVRDIEQAKQLWTEWKRRQR